MGKGRRNREKRAEDHSAYEELTAHIARAKKQLKPLTVTTVVLTAFGIAFQALLQSIMYGNLRGGVYEAKNTSADEIAALTKILPTGTIALVLLAIGVVATAWLLLKQKPSWSLIGCLIVAAGIAFFVPYAYNLSLLFTYDPLAGINGEGLSLSALIWQHYSALFPLLLLIPCEWLGFYIQRKAFVADVMKEAQDTTSTLLLDEEDGE